MTGVLVSHNWTRITDLPDDWRTLGRPDLDHLLKRWTEERGSLKDPHRVEQLQDRLATRWAIETGVIERLYSIDRGMTETLVDLGIEALQQFRSAGRIPQRVARLIEDQRAALDFVFAFLKEERKLSLSYIKELHQLLLQNQVTTEAIDQHGTRMEVDLIKGDWKRLPNNPLTEDGTIHEYCPPEFVQDEMEALLRMHRAHGQLGVPPEIEAAWLHHRFSQIHPFQDGNGRVARALATLVFLRAGFLPLVVRDVEHRSRYISALEEADRGDLSPLVALFANIQAADLEDAITFVREIRGGDIAVIATSAADAAKRRLAEDQGRLDALTQRLVDVTRARLEEISSELRQAFERVGMRLDAKIFNSIEGSETVDGNESWWYYQIVHAAREYKYYFDRSRRRRWLQMRLDVPGANVPRWSIVVSWHHKESRADVMATVVFLTSTQASAEDEKPVILGSPNEWTYSSRSDVSEESFREWLDQSFARVLEVWQSRI